MEGLYLPDSMKTIEMDDWYYSDYYEYLIDNDKNSEKWHTGQSYEKEPAIQLKCKICGSDKFNVAQGSYWTGLKCVKCKYEICVHNG